MSQSKSFIKNISSNYIIYGFRIALGIYALPVCLNAFGAELYGLYIICFGLSASLAAFDMGSSKSIFRYAVEYNKDESKEKFEEAFNVGLSFNIFASILIAVAMIIIGINCDLLFNITPEANSFALTLFSLAAINSFLLTLGAVPQNLLTANQHFHIRNKFHFVILLFNLALLIAINVGVPITIIEFAIGSTILTILTFITDIYLVRRKKIIAQLKLSLIFGKKLLKNNYTGYSLQVFALALVSFLAVQADRIIIASVLDVSAVAVYAIITKPYFVLRGIIAISYPVIQPTLNTLNLEPTKENFAKFTGKIIRTGFVAMLSITLIVSVFYDSVLTLWLGTDSYNTYIQWGILSLITLCITMLYGPFFRTLAHSSQIKTILNFSVISTFGNVIISVLLSRQFGFFGVIIGTFVQILAECIFSYTRFAIKLKPYNNNTFNVRFIITCCILIFITLVVAYFSENLSTTLLTESLFFIILLAIVTITAYIYIKKEAVFQQFSSISTDDSKITAR